MNETDVQVLQAIQRYRREHGTRLPALVVVHPSYYRAMTCRYFQIPVLGSTYQREQVEVREMDVERTGQSYRHGIVPVEMYIQCLSEFQVMRYATAELIDIDK